jgi:lipid-binding SYLF domain-containing protein
MRAEILSWSRTHGLFAGVSLDGTFIKHDRGETKKLYEQEDTNHQILRGQVPAPPAAREFIAELDARAPAHR